MTAITPASTLYGATPATPNVAAAGAAANATPTETDFLQLLVAQLKNQDPTSPQDPSAFVGELAQFSEVEQTTKVASNTTTMTQQLGQIVSPTAPYSTTPDTGATTGN